MSIREKRQRVPAEGAGRLSDLYYRLRRRRSCAQLSAITRAAALYRRDRCQRHCSLDKTRRNRSARAETDARRLIRPPFDPPQIEYRSRGMRVISRKLCTKIRDKCAVSVPRARMNRASACRKTRQISLNSAKVRPTPHKKKRLCRDCWYCTAPTSIFSAPGNRRSTAG